MTTNEPDQEPALGHDARRKATVGFEKLGEAMDMPMKNLIRIFGPGGNPQARNLFGVIGYLQKQAGIEMRVAPELGKGSVAILRRTKL